MLTEEQRLIRKGKIGSSDVAAILGVDPYQNAADVWARVTGRVQIDRQSEAIDLGNMLEAPLLMWAGEELGKKLELDVPTITLGDWQVSHPDALVIGEHTAMEAKTVGLTGRPRDLDAWGEEGTDEVPDKVLVQTHHQMLCGGFKTIWVPALIGLRGRVLYRIDRNEKLCASIHSRVEQFISDYVLTDYAPDDVPSMATLRALKRQPISKPLPAAIIEEWRAAEAAYKAAEAARDDAKARVISAMGDAEAGESPLGYVTFREQQRKAHSVEASTCRVLRFKAMKGDK